MVWLLLKPVLQECLLQAPHLDLFLLSFVYFPISPLIRDEEGFKGGGDVGGA